MKLLTATITAALLFTTLPAQASSYQLRQSCMSLTDTMVGAVSMHKDLDEDMQEALQTNMLRADEELHYLFNVALEFDKNSSRSLRANFYRGCVEGLGKPRFIAAYLEE